MKKRGGGASVPQFGAWGDHDDFEEPYSMIFETAREERSRKHQAPPPELGHGRKSLISKEGDSHGSRLAHLDRYTEKKTGTQSSPQRAGGEGHPRNEGKKGRTEEGGSSSTLRPSGGPLHPSEASAPLPSSLEENQNRPPLRNLGGLDSLGKGIYRTALVGERKLPPESPDNKGLIGTVPKFGDWNRDPSAADGYTGVFEQARRERKADGDAPNTQLESPMNIGGYEETHKHPEGSYTRNCFPLFACCFASSGAR